MKIQETPTNVTIKGILGLLMANLDDDDEKKKRVISLGMGDPTAFSCFTTTCVAENAVVEALTCQKFNGYSPTVGLPQTRRYFVLGFLDSFVEMFFFNDFSGEWIVCNHYDEDFSHAHQLFVEMHDRKFWDCLVGFFKG